jgi:hypothetical protein
MINAEKNELDSDVGIPDDLGTIMTRKRRRD